MIIKFLENITNNDLKEVGGKAASLGELIQSGNAVPNGFVITTEAYKRFYNQKIPTEIGQEILQAFDKLGAKRVAVRSSAVAEDSPTFSWAGQLESYLNISREELLDYIIKCWASISSERALFYGVQQKIKKEEIGIGVIVHEMVNPEISGVLFTVNPISKNYDEIMIESGFGLGEVLVQGLISPDSFVVDKKTFKIKTKKINYQKLKLSFLEGKNKKIILSKAEGSKQTISDEQVKELAKLGTKIEKYYAQPQDIEWAIEKGSIYILQSRPITTLDRKIENKYSINLSGKELLSGLPASYGIKSGKARIIKNLNELSEVKDGEILVAVKTTPDFVQAFSKAVAIVTDQGGMTSHAAIISREFGIPSIVGAKMATQILKNGQVITVDGNRGKVYEGEVILKSQIRTDSKVQELAYTGNDIDDMVNAIMMSINDATELWPLKPGQLMPYFDTDQAVDLYKKLENLLNSGVNFDKIARLIKHPTSLRLFLLNSGLVGFKAGRVLKIAPVNFEDQMKFTDWVIKILKQFAPKDPFCLKGTNYVWDNNKVEEFIVHSSWLELDASLKRTIGILNANLIIYVWSFFWDYFPDASFENYGPYVVNSGDLGDDNRLLIRDYFNLVPTEVWPLAKNLPFKKLVIAQSYNKEDLFLNFGNRISNKESLINDNHYVTIKVDNRYITENEEILEIAQTLSSVAKQQINVVNHLTDMDKVRKGSMLAYYAMKDFYSYFNKKWYPSEKVESTIKALGDKFLIQNRLQKDMNPEEKRKFFDPRNNIF